MSDATLPESFAEFKNSFSYGSRSDLNFKFLKGLPDEEAANFIQELFWKISDAADAEDFAPVLEHWRTAQMCSYAGGAGRWAYADGPFTPLSKPLAQTNLALFTSSGHFVDGDDPRPFGVENMTQTESAARIDDFLKEEPQLSQIPSQTPDSALRVRHGGYDIRAAQQDPNVNFPLSHLQGAVAEGRIGELAATAYSFVGACSQLRLLRKNGPEWVRMLQAQSIGAVLLVPV